MSIARHSLYNVIGILVPVLVSVVTIPLYLEVLGVDRYGVWALFWVILGYSSVFDLGLGRATAQQIAANANLEVTERSKIFWTATWLNLSLGLLGALVVLPAAYWFLKGSVETGAALQTESVRSLIWLLIGVPVTTLLACFSGTLQGLQRFKVLNTINVGGTVALQIAPLIVAWQAGVDLFVLVPAAVLAKTLQCVCLYIACTQSGISGIVSGFSKRWAKVLIGFGGWVTVYSMLGKSITFLDRLIIASVNGAKAVAAYHVPLQIAENSTVLSSALASALFPRLAVGNTSDAKQLALSAIRSLAVITTPLYLVGLLVLEPLIAVWISEDFATQAAPIGQVLLIGYWFNGFAKISNSLLLARANPRAIAICHAVEIVPFVCGMWWAAAKFGPIGAAAMVSIRILIDLCLLAAIAGIFLKVVFAVLIPASLLVFALCLTFGQSFFAYPIYVLTNGLLFIVTAVWSVIFAPPGTSGRIRRVFSSRTQLAF